MTHEASPATGVPGLDAVLGGPIVPGSLAFIVGAPGAGKTVLASQLLFAAAQQGQQTIIFTSYSETQGKLLQHLQGFAFFDHALIGGAVTLLTLPDLTTTDAAGATAMLVRIIREYRAQLVLLDGFQSVEPMLGDPQALRQFLGGLSTQLSYIDATVLVTLTGDGRDGASTAFLTTADLLVSLTYQLVGTRHMRTLDVVKQRGRAQLPGRHTYRIDDQGITVLPRIEVFPRPASPPPSLGRAPFGLPELDSLLGGGPNTGTTTLLAGAPGTGKTSLALHWALHAASTEASTIFVTFREYAVQLEQKAAAFGLDLQAATATGNLRIMRVDPFELDVDRVGVELVTALEARSARVVIDDLAPLLRELGSRAHDYLAALAAHLYGAGVTTLMLLEIAPFVGFRLNLMDSPLGDIGESVVLIQQHAVAGVVHRVLAVLRMRLSAHDQTLREVTIGAQGVRVLSVNETNPSVLASAAGEQGGLGLPPAPSEASGAA